MADVTEGTSATKANGALRVRLAAGGANESSPPLVVEIGADGAPLVDGQTESATLAVHELPRARLADVDGNHDVLILPLPDGRRRAAGIQRVEVVLDGWRFEVDVEPEARARLRDRATRAGSDRARGGPVEVRAIIPGRIAAVNVAEGDSVEAGARVLVVEAMKMQNEIRAPRAGTVRRIDAVPGNTVEPGDVLLVIE